MYATAPATVAKTVTKTVSGSIAQVDRWGELQLTLVVKKTTVGKKVTRRITAVKVPLSPNHTNRSIFINQQALPILIQETMQAQSSRIDMVSGATDTSGGFAQSLQSAILKARAW